MSYQHEQQAALVAILRSVSNSLAGIRECVPFVDTSIPADEELVTRLHQLRKVVGTAAGIADACAKEASDSSLVGIVWRVAPPKKPEVK